MTGKFSLFTFGSICWKIYLFVAKLTLCFLPGLDGAEVDRTTRIASRRNDTPLQVYAIGP